MKEDDNENDENNKEELLDQVKDLYEYYKALNRNRQLPKASKQINVIRESIELQYSLMEKAGSVNQTNNKLVRSKSAFVPKNY